MMNWLNQLWCLGRRSTVAYLRFYPNPGFMIPWPGGRRLRGSWFYGLSVRPAAGNPRGN